MRNFLRSWWPRAVSRRGVFIAPRLERLENRIVFALSATPLPFTALDTAHIAAALTAPNQFNLYDIHLIAGDVVNIAVSSQAGGGAMQSNLRIFDATGHPLALDAQQGGDAHLTFQAPREGDYLVGVSSAGDDAYDPAVAGSGQGGVTTGVYALDLQREPAGTLTPELAGSSFRLQADTAAYGDTISGTFTVDNRGGAAASAFAVQVVLSPDNRFGPYFLVLTTVAVPGLGAGQEFASGVFTLALPSLAQATAAGLPESGPVYLGLRIDPSGAVPELNPHYQSGVHAGEDWQALTLVTPITANGNNHSPARAEVLVDLNSQISGVLTGGQTDWYQATLPDTGRLTATITAAGGITLAPLLTLAGPDGQMVVQSDDTIVQSLQPGTYYLEVSTQSRAGNYQLTSEFVPGSLPFGPVPLHSGPPQLVMADVNGDGKPDIITANPYDNSVSVLLGNGDGTFGSPRTFAVGSLPVVVAVADVNGDGKPDLVVSNFFSNTVSVLLGNGDGTFQTQQTFPVGRGPGVVVADVNGDSKPDIITPNQYDNSVSVLLGNGDGTFQKQQTFAIASGLMLNVALAVVDVNGDGKPDLVTANSGVFGNSISVLLGKGDGTFQPQHSFPISHEPYSFVAADVNGDGKPDLITVNSIVDYQISLVAVMLGNGDGTFGPPTNLPRRRIQFFFGTQRTGGGRRQR